MLFFFNLPRMVSTVSVAPVSLGGRGHSVSEISMSVLSTRVRIRALAQYVVCIP